MVVERALGDHSLEGELGKVNFFLPDSTCTSNTNHVKQKSSL